jgi:murein DD-endopeptidase MepM/ murein hydrolase activator NlpD
MIPVVVQPGDTLSGIAAQYGTSYQAIAAATPGLTNPNLIYAGETVDVPTGGANAAPTYNSSPSNTSYAPSTPTPAPASTTDGQFSVPGMPQGLANCIAFRESTDGELSSDIFGIIPASGYNVSGDSVAQQEQVAGQLYAADGAQPWAPSDGC